MNRSILFSIAAFAVLAAVLPGMALAVTPTATPAPTCEQSCFASGSAGSTVLTFNYGTCTSACKDTPTQQYLDCKTAANKYNACTAKVTAEFTACKTKAETMFAKQGYDITSANIKPIVENLVKNTCGVLTDKLSATGACGAQPDLTCNYPAVKDATCKALCDAGKTRADTFTANLQGQCTAKCSLASTASGDVCKAKVDQALCAFGAFTLTTDNSATTASKGKYVTFATDVPVAQVSTTGCKAKFYPMTIRSLTVYQGNAYSATSTIPKGQLVLIRTDAKCTVQYQPAGCTASPAALPGQAE